MGQEAVYKCNKCSNEFKQRGGGGFFFNEYRCVNCDTIKIVKTGWKCARADEKDEYHEPTKEEIGVCGKCGGKLSEDLRPMCPACKSRDVEEKEVLIDYD